MALTRRKFFGFAAAAALLSLLITLAGVLAADLYLHHRAERSAGLNRWGYRGPVLGRKQAGEVRVAMLGGSTVFGYGGTWDEAIPALLEEQLNQRDPGRRWRGINLGFNNEGAYAYLPTLQDFANLDPDAVVLYGGYNDMLGDGGPNLAVFRHESPVFRLTGYWPILPAIFNEKALAIRFGGNLDAAYQPAAGNGGDRVVFRPGLAQRASAAALEAALTVGDSLSRQLDRVIEHPPAKAETSSRSGCATPWIHYCDSVHRAVQYARSHGAQVVVVSQPRMIDPKASRVQESQREALAAMVARQFGGDSRVTYVDLSTAVDLSDREYSFDSMHLGLDGNRVIAGAMVEPVLRMAGRR